MNCCSDSRVCFCRVPCQCCCTECVCDDWGDPDDVPWDEIDPGIAVAVHALIDHGVETLYSCQGGPGHTGYGGMPTVFFHGDDHAGLWAVWLLELQGLHVHTLSRHWSLDHCRPRQPCWQVTLMNTEPMPPRPGTRLVPVDESEGTW